MLFSDIIGLEDIKQRLIGSYKNNHVAHAQLFSGKKGGGGLALALAFATYLNCTNKQENDACGECPSCHKNKKCIHPDLNFAFPVSKIEKKEISSHFLPEWRKFLLEQPYGDDMAWSAVFGGENKQLNISKEESRQIIQHLALMPVEGEFKFMLIWLPEFLHPFAANGILKILEEPPARTIFLLVSNDHENLIGTIRSRTQIFIIPPFSDQEVVQYLIDKHGLEQSKAMRIAHAAEGNIQEAIYLIDEMEDNNLPIFRDWMRQCFRTDLPLLLKSAENFAGMTKSGQKGLLQYSLGVFRESVIALAGATALRKGTPEDQEFIDKFVGVLDAHKIEKAIDLLNQSLYHLERNANAKMCFLGVSFDLSQLFRA